MQRTWSGYWYWLPLAVLMIIIVHTLNVSWTASTRAERQHAHTLPEMPLAELKQRIDSMQRTIDGTERGTPEQYFALLGEAGLLQAAAQRADVLATRPVHTDSEPRLLRMASLSLHNDLSNKQVEFGLRSADAERINAARLGYQRLDGYSRVDQSNDWSAVLAFVWAFVWIGLFAAPTFFVIRLNRERQKIAIQLPQIVYWSALWPVGLFKYPTNLDIPAQVLRAKRQLAAFASMLLATGACGGAYAKSGPVSGKNAKSDTEQVHLVGPPDTVTFSDPPKPQLLPTINVGEVAFNIRGWLHLKDTLASDAGPELAMLKLRGLVDAGDFTIFSQFDPRATHPVDELWLGYRASAKVTVKVGHMFHQGGNPAPAPFLMESITPPDLPIAFFGTGVAVEAMLSDVVSFGLDVTGDSRAPFLSRHTFDRGEVSANLKLSQSNGFVRLSAQQAGNLRVILDGEHKAGSNTVRGAAYYHPSRDMVGGYVLYGRQLNNWLSVFGQLEAANDDIAGRIGVSAAANDNLKFTLEVGDKDVALRTRFRF